MKKRRALQIMRAIYFGGKPCKYSKNDVAKMERWRYRKDIILPGDFYEGCDFRPRKCVSVEFDVDYDFYAPTRSRYHTGQLYGISLLGDQEGERGCGISECGSIRLTKEMVDERIKAFKEGGMDFMIDTVCNKGDRWGLGSSK